MSIDAKIDALFAPVSQAVADVIFYSVTAFGQDIKLILLWLVAAAVFFTVYLGFINVRYFGHAINILRGKYDKKNEKGQINRFQALSTSLSGTVGLGNIAGVAVAVSAGGPGAVFWMMMMGVFGMTSKFVEATLGVKYRCHTDPSHPEEYSGGPMYYIKEAFVRRDQENMGVALAGLFAICCIGGAIGAGNMFQANQAFQQVMNVTGGEESFLVGKGWLFGLVLSVMVGLVIIGGLKSIAAVASRVVPFMGAVYILGGLIVIGAHFADIPDAIMTILSMAFSLEAGFGGLLGGLLVGVQRAAFSNEAGVGSAAIVHSTAKTNVPVTQGFVAMLGPFIDTVIICMVTALVIVITGSYELDGKMEGVELTSRAFETILPWFPYVLTLTVLLFAYSTMIAWSYYGLKSCTYLFGDNPIVALVYKIFFCSLVVVGASAALDNVILFSDSIFFAMAIPNIIAMYLFAPEIKQDLEAYLAKVK